MKPLRLKPPVRSIPMLGGMNRFGTREEVAAIVHFLASDDASFVTGQTYDVSGRRATY
jgi:NAD(P)-dependent dehydrogenase (short-subunit alcohol dehydrogenase family)